ncbi:MAG: hypothetical protein HY208_09555 [Nitrospirae bacterium]|nr:hypothetical protein [Nitrospirota bacterium]
MTTATATGTPEQKRPLDLTIFGVLFLISAPMELGSILSTGWNYPVKFFGVELAGLARTIWLGAHPLFHLVMGYGFLKQYRWVIYLTCFYAADAMTSAVVRFYLQGYGFWRTVFLVAIPPFVIYVIARRRYFVR